MDALEILSRVYSLLSDCRSNEIRNASMIADSSDLRNALNSLARLKSSIEKKQRNAAKRTKKFVETDQQQKMFPMKPSNGYEKILQKMLFDTKLFPMNADVSSFLISLNLRTNFRGKDGRIAMYDKLLRTLKRMRPSYRRQTLLKFQGLLPKSETAGWFEAIRGENE